MILEQHRLIRTELNDDSLFFILRNAVLTSKHATQTSLGQARAQVMQALQTPATIPQSHTPTRPPFSLSTSAVSQSGVPLLQSWATWPAPPSFRSGGVGMTAIQPHSGSDQLVIPTFFTSTSTSFNPQTGQIRHEYHDAAEVSQEARQQRGLLIDEKIMQESRAKLQHINEEIERLRQVRMRELASSRPRYIERTFNKPFEILENRAFVQALEMQSNQMRVQLLQSGQHQDGSQEGARQQDRLVEFYNHQRRQKEATFVRPTTSVRSYSILDPKPPKKEVPKPELTLKPPPHSMSNLEVAQILSSFQSNPVQSSASEKPPAPPLSSALSSQESSKNIAARMDVPVSSGLDHSQEALKEQSHVKPVTRPHTTSSRTALPEHKTSLFGASRAYASPPIIATTTSSSSLQVHLCSTTPLPSTMLDQQVDAPAAKLSVFYPPPSNEPQTNSDQSPLPKLKIGQVYGRRFHPDVAPKDDEAQLSQPAEVPREMTPPSHVRGTTHLKLKPISQTSPEKAKRAKIQEADEPLLGVQVPDREIESAAALDAPREGLISIN
jgi:hypothetical protein